MRLVGQELLRQVSREFFIAGTQTGSRIQLSTRIMIPNTQLSKRVKKWPEVYYHYHNSRTMSDGVLWV